MGEGRTDEPPANQRLTVAQAAARLGITEGAVRSRIKRGTLRTEPEGGRVFVLLGDGTPPTDQPPNTGEPSDPAEPGSTLAAQMQARIDDLREQLQAERRANEENRRIIAGLTSRIPAIEAPQDPPPDAPRPPTAGEDEPGGTSPRPDTAGSQSAPQRPRRSLWRWVIGG